MEYRWDCLPVKPQPSRAHYAAPGVQGKEGKRGMAHKKLFSLDFKHWVDGKHAYAKP